MVNREEEESSELPLFSNKDLPTFEIPVLVGEVPAELAKLPPQSRVHLIMRGGVPAQCIGSAEDCIGLLKWTMDRQSKGFLRISEACLLLAELTPLPDQISIRDSIVRAFEAGKLPVHSYADETLRLPSDLLRLALDLVRVDELNRWLASEGTSYRLSIGTVGVPAVAPVSRARAQELAILTELRELGFDPLALPPTPPGKPSPAKQAAKSALSYSDRVFEKAWQRLRDSGQIQED